MNAEKKPIPPRKLSFGEAVTEVEEILARLEDDEVDIDLLGQEVARAVALLQVCREKLTKTEGEVRDLVSGLQADETADKDAAPEGD
ncbi:exodeoxyribonuclease VII small subunit [bacterium CG_4_9_14_3_um_filter_65_15]|nr:MAG: exodeoxyribonuclease VII small subunit [bacterium CG_4_9_14_3_um_filter_65_15]